MIDKRGITVPMNDRTTFYQAKTAGNHKANKICFEKEQHQGTSPFLSIMDACRQGSTPPLLFP